jgi:redox-sensing transcriptional repressor
MAKYRKIPEATIQRLSIYLKCLEDLEQKGEKVASSSLIALTCHVNSSQVRKDFDYFGEFGIRGMGYNVKDLRSHIKEILGTNREWRIAVAGVGNVGSALLMYKGFLKESYKVVAAFDTEPVKVIGHIAEEMGKPIEILHIDHLKEIVKARDIEIGMITTPASEAQKVANQFIEADIKGILNFAPTQIHVPANVVLRNVFFTFVLDDLVYHLSN